MDRKQKRRGGQVPFLGKVGVRGCTISIAKTMTIASDVALTQNTRPRHKSQRYSTSCSTNEIRHAVSEIHGMKPFKSNHDIIAEGVGSLLGKDTCNRGFHCLARRSISSNRRKRAYKATKQTWAVSCLLPCCNMPTPGASNRLDVRAGVLKLREAIFEIVQLSL